MRDPIARDQVDLSQRLADDLGRVRWPRGGGAARHRPPAQPPGRAGRLAVRTPVAVRGVGRGHAAVPAAAGRSRSISTAARRSAGSDDHRTAEPGVDTPGGVAERRKTSGRAWSAVGPRSTRTNPSATGRSPSRPARNIRRCAPTRAATCSAGSRPWSTRRRSRDGRRRRGGAAPERDAAARRRRARPGRRGRGRHRTVCPKYTSTGYADRRRRDGEAAAKSPARRTSGQLLDKGFAGDESVLFEHRIMTPDAGVADLGGSEVLVIRVGDLVATVEQVNGDSTGQPPGGWPSRAAGLALHRRHATLLKVRRRGPVRRPRAGAGRPGPAGQHRAADLGERVELFRGEQIEQVAPDGGDPVVGGTLDRRPPGVGEPEHGAARVFDAVFPHDQAAGLHPAQVVREPALLPLHLTAQRQPAQPVVGRGEQRGQDREVGVGQPGLLASSCRLSWLESNPCIRR